MERDIGGPTSPPIPDGGIPGSKAPKLSALFAMEQQKLQSGNSSFRYHPPKLPTTQISTPKVVPVAGFTSNGPGPNDSVSSAPTLQVVHSVAVLQLLISNTSGSKSYVGTAGMAILETISTQTKGYHIVVYDASKRSLVNTAITRDFVCTPIADCWVNFSSASQTWSALFRSPEDWADFARAVVLARSVVARVSNSFLSVLIQDISPQQDISQTGLRDGDMVQVTYKAWTERPGVPGSLGASFQETTGKGKKLELGSGKAIQGLEQGVLGMTKSSRRLLIIPPHLGYLSAPQRPERVPADAILFFDVSVSRTRKLKGPVGSESSYGRELPSDQLSYNGDAGSEREDLTAPNSNNNNLNEEMKITGTGPSTDAEENVPEHKDLTGSKRDLLIDRMARLSRIGGAGSYNLPNSSIGSDHKRNNVESTHYHTDDFDLVLDNSIQDTDIDNTGIHNSSPNNSTRSSPEAIDSTFHSVVDSPLHVNNWQEDGLAELETLSLEHTAVDDEIPLVSKPDYFHDEEPQQPNSGHNLARKNSPFIDNLTVHEVSAGLVDPITFLNAEVTTGPKILSSSSAPTYSGMDRSKSSQSSGPQPLQTTLPSTCPPLAAQVLPFPPFFNPGNTTSTATDIPSSYSMMNPALSFPPLGQVGYAPSVLPWQAVSPYSGYPHGFIPWFPCGFPQYVPPPHGVPSTGSYENQQIKLLQSIQQAQETFAESLRDLTSKVDALSEVSDKRAGLHDSRYPSGQWMSGLESGGKEMISQGQPNEDSDVQVDSVVESVALMLAENRELRRRLLELNDQSALSITAEGTQSIQQSVDVVKSEKILDVPFEDVASESSSNIQRVSRALETCKSSVIPQSTTGSYSELDLIPSNGEDLSRTETDLTGVISNDLKLAMNNVYREVVMELGQGPDVEQSFPVVHKKLMDGVVAVMRVLQDRSLFASQSRTGLDLVAPSVYGCTTSPSTYEEAGMQQKLECSVTNAADGSPTFDGGKEEGDDVDPCENVSLVAPEIADDCIRLADHEDLKRLSDCNSDDLKYAVSGNSELIADN